MESDDDTALKMFWRIWIIARISYSIKQYHTRIKRHKAREKNVCEIIIESLFFTCKIYCSSSKVHKWEIYLVGFIWNWSFKFLCDSEVLFTLVRRQCLNLTRIRFVFWVLHVAVKFTYLSKTCYLMKESNYAIWKWYVKCICRWHKCCHSLDSEGSISLRQLASLVT